MTKPGIMLNNPYVQGKKQYCKCGASYYYQWGTEDDPMCYGCAKAKYKPKSVVLEGDAMNQKPHGTLQVQQLCICCEHFWTIDPLQICVPCRDNGAVTLAKFEDGTQVIDKDGYAMRGQWPYRTMHCTLCYKKIGHTVMAHQMKLKEYDASLYNISNKVAKIPLKCYKHKWDENHKCMYCGEWEENALLDALEEIGASVSDTYQGQKGPISINIPTENMSVVSEIRPFTYSDYKTAESHELLSNKKKKKTGYNITIQWDDEASDGPSKASGHVMTEEEYAIKHGTIWYQDAIKAGQGSLSFQEFLKWKDEQ